MRYDSIDASHFAPASSGSPRLALTHAELRRLVRYWVGMLKESGLPPEEVLIAVKSLVRDTIVPRYERYADGKDDDDVRIAFVRDASQWCIDAYFESPTVPNDAIPAPRVQRGAADSPPDGRP